MKLTIAYCGAPEFSADFLEMLLADKTLPIEVKYVLTQPDRPVGRKQIVTPAPVKGSALQHKIQVIDRPVEQSGIDFSSLDMVLVYAYGEIIPAQFLHQPRLGWVNVHPSLLPKFRGPSPIAYPIFLNEKKSGVTIMQMDEKVDHGPVIAQDVENTFNDVRKSDAEKMLTGRGYALFHQVIDDYLKSKKTGPLPSRLQNDGGATFTRLLKKQDGFVAFEVLKKAVYGEPLPQQELPHIMKQYYDRSGEAAPLFTSQTLYNLFRGLYPWPGIWTTLPDGKRLKLTDMNFSDNKLVLKTVQLEGKNRVDFPTFRRAYHFF